MYSRTEALIGKENTEKLKNAKVLVVGLGGVGAYIVEALARSGVGTLGICDFDRVDVSNKNRQILALDSTLGRLKSDVCEERIADINKDCSVIKFSSKFDDFMITDYSWDYVADAIDDIPAKLRLIKLCKDLEIPVISSMGTGNKINPSAYKIADISKTNTCPLAKKVRTELRKLGIEKGVDVLFSDETPYKDAYDVIPTIAYMPSIAGLLISSKIIQNMLDLTK